MFFYAIKKFHFNHYSQRNNDIAADDACNFIKYSCLRDAGGERKKLLLKAKFYLHIMYGVV